MSFKDLFSTQSVDYSKYRPTYPQELFEFIALQVEDKGACWDVGTGNGQAAVELAKYFKKVIATDPSEAQINNATPKDNIEYKVCRAESSSLDNNSIDLLTVAQAYHWFDHIAFYKEVKRVTKTKAKIAIWCYGLSTVNAKVDAVYMKFYKGILDGFWPPERVHVENAYASLPFPYKNHTQHEFKLIKSWNLQDYMNYLSTWSAVQKYIKTNNKHPLDLVTDEFIKTWGNPEEKKEVTFPVILRMGEVDE